MLVSDIATRVKRQFGDEVGAEITDVDIIRWVNDAQKEIAIKNDLLQIKATLTTVVGTAEYSLPTGILTLRSVKYQGRGLNAMTLKEADDFIYDTDAADSSGIPSAYWVYAGKLVLYPTPQTASTTDISIYYSRVPVEVTLVGDTPELPIQYHTRIVEYCIAQAHELDDNSNAYDAKMGQFTAGVNALKDNLTWTQRDQYPSITVSLDDAGEWY